MTRQELSRQFDDAIGQALDQRQWTSMGAQRFALVALAIAVRGLWSDDGKLEPDLRDFMPPVNQGGG